MRDREQIDEPRRRLAPFAAWSLTAVMSVAVAGNALFGQPRVERAAVIASGDPEAASAEGAAAAKQDNISRTIQLKYDPVVESVQRELAAAGYYKGSIDGVVGRKTREAISAYQAAAGLKPDGKPSAELAEHIRFTREVAEASLFTGTVEPSPDAEARARVRRVQTTLAELAYSPGQISGEMNAQTEEAIAAFQRDRNLEATGTIDDALLAELSKVSGQSGAEAQPQ
jgi:peptidoglycan hydrolase-like protein with peptidoglycan-binding domain